MMGFLWYTEINAVYSSSLHIAASLEFCARGHERL